MRTLSGYCENIVVIKDMRRLNASEHRRLLQCLRKFLRESRTLKFCAEVREYCVNEYCAIILWQF